jgi:hypothetical protein
VQCSEERLATIAAGVDFVVVTEVPSEVRLRIDVDGKDSTAGCGEQPAQSGGARRLADPALALNDS